MAPIIELKNYSWRYLNADTFALKNINLTIDEGRFVGIIGKNGSGKTTLAYSIDGLIPGQYHGIQEGSVMVFGKNTEEYGHGSLQQTVGMVFADPEAQFTAMTVEDELVFGMENLGMSIPEIRERLEWVTNLVDLKPLMLKPPYEISGGQKQRVALAAVLAMTPKIMLLDEPTSMLDPISRKRVFDVLAKLKTESNSTIIVIEHSLENLIPLSDQMVLMHEGDLLLADDTQAFFHKMDFLVESGVFPPEMLLFFHNIYKSGCGAGLLPLTVDQAAAKLKEVFAAARQTSTSIQEA